MNAPFKAAALDTIRAKARVSISELRKNPAAVIAAAREQQVAILNRNTPVAYVIAPHVWDYLCDLHEDMKDAEIVRERLAEDDQIIEVRLEDLSSDLPEEGDAGVEQARRHGEAAVRQ